MAKALNNNAGKTLTTSLDGDSINKLFFEARKEFINKKISTNLAWNAYVTADVFNTLVDSVYTVQGKGSAINISFFGF